MTYKEAIEYIHNTPKFSRVLGNDMLKKLLGAIGNPQSELEFIHIAGTNGKGSVAFMLAEILKASGRRTGLFISPYIERFNERISVDGEQISDRELAKTVAKIKSAIEKNDAPVSEFALDAAVAFDYFNRKKCDIVVLETGLGGRLDATNVIEKSVVSVITSIGLDHMQYLGETIPEIAAEKAGIIKNGGTVVTGCDLSADALAVIEKTATANSASVFVAEKPEMSDGNDFAYNGTRYRVGMDGDFQKRNAATVLCVCERLNALGYGIKEDEIRFGLENAFNPGRLEKTKCGLYFDGAHNLQAVSALAAELKKMDKPIYLCIAMMSDKAVDDCVKVLSEAEPTVIATELDMPRCMPATELAKKFRENGVRARAVKNPQSAAVKTVFAAGNDGCAVVCGSLYLVGELRKSFCGEYYTYIIRCADNSLYTGYTTDVARRFEEHRSSDKKGAGYTRIKGAASVEAVWRSQNRSFAMKLEAFIKKLKKEEKEALIKNPDSLSEMSGIPGCIYEPEKIL